MTVSNREEAWREANRLFPTDYEQDARSSQNAGYPIYESTSSTNRSWISDLGNRLELNIWGDNGVESINIWIEDEPIITEEKQISSSSVRECCIKHDLYTSGSCREYDKMLNMADENEFSLRLLYDLAKDITEHSEDQTITSVMFLLNKDAVNTFYTVE